VAVGAAVVGMRYWGRKPTPTPAGPDANHQPTPAARAVGAEIVEEGLATEPAGGSQAAVPAEEVVGAERMEEGAEAGPVGASQAALAEPAEEGVAAAPESSPEPIAQPVSIEAAEEDPVAAACCCTVFSAPDGQAAPTAASVGAGSGQEQLETMV